jgi:hypothetical protein
MAISQFGLCVVISRLYSLFQSTIGQAAVALPVGAGMQGDGLDEQDGRGNEQGGCDDQDGGGDGVDQSLAPSS